jgi:hypothetical protein
VPDRIAAMLRLEFDAQHDAVRLAFIVAVFLLEFGAEGDRAFSATRPCWSIGDWRACDDSMKLRLLSSGCEFRPARGEPARAGSEPCDGLGNGIGEA